MEAIAVCFLFSFVNPAHERRARELIARDLPQIVVSLSSEVDPAFREYERTVVTAFDAYVKPVLGHYLERLEARLRAAGVGAPLQLMQSRGGVAASASRGSGRCGCSSRAPPPASSAGAPRAREPAKRRSDHRRYRRHQLAISR